MEYTRYTAVRTPHNQTIYGTTAVSTEGEGTTYAENYQQLPSQQHMTSRIHRNLEDNPTSGSKDGENGISWDSGDVKERLKHPPLAPPPLHHHWHERIFNERTPLIDDEALIRNFNEHNQNFCCKCCFLPCCAVFCILIFVCLVAGYFFFPRMPIIRNNEITDASVTVTPQFLLNFTLYFALDNPNYVAVTISELRFDIFYRGEKVGNVSLPIGRSFERWSNGQEFEVTASLNKCTPAALPKLTGGCTADGFVNLDWKGTLGVAYLGVAKSFRLALSAPATCY
jgi:hypothetical protein